MDFYNFFALVNGQIADDYLLNDMVKIVYKHGLRTTVDSNQTVNAAIKLVVDSNDADNCAVFFNGTKLDGEMVIGSIPGINDRHTLRVLRKDPPSVLSEKNDPPTQSLSRIFESLNDTEKNKLTETIDMPDFRQRIMKKYPELMNDCELVDVISDMLLVVTIVMKGKTNFVEKHPLFQRVIYAIYELTFKPEEVARIFSESPMHLGQNSGAYSSADFARLLGMQLPNPVQTAPMNRPNQIITNELFASAMQQALNNSATTPSTSSSSVREPPPLDLNALRQKYASELQQLHDYGFVDDDENIRALNATDGNFEAALELIIQARE
ncbi:Ubiquitin-like protein 7 [Aphelenchoides besseyi]|nr:Ubiquitin-like protein 7 [Aphelenchoides besseyi]KAI6207827.1 Ubiquitin-like protein 7 [Aphelenchoides besseyi]